MEEKKPIMKVGKLTIEALDTKKYVHLSEYLTEVGKMLGGWRKQLQNKTLAG